MYRAPIHFGALGKSTYNLTTRPHQNGLGLQNVWFYVHRGAAAKMFHFSFTVITCFSHIFFFFLFRLFSFSFFSFFPFLPPLRVPPRANRPPLPPSVRHCVFGGSRIDRLSYLARKKTTTTMDDDNENNNGIQREQD